MAKLPPPDPFEPRDPEGLELTASAVVFLEGTPTAADERLANAIVAARPGALVVVGKR